MMKRSSYIFVTKKIFFINKKIIFMNYLLLRNFASMAEIFSKSSPTFRNIVEKLEEYAPSILAEKWDNTGIIIEPFTPRLISSIMLTNDLTEDVMKEAVEKNVQMIISYHPPIFSPLKCITQRSWKERIASECLERGISVYSPHTRWDAVEGGVNDWLTHALPPHSSSPISQGELPATGCGRICILKNAISLEKCIDSVKLHCGLSNIRLATARGSNMNSPVNKVAVCAGSGASLLRGVAADLYLTGEMLHHDVLDAVHNGTSVILTNHSDSERGFLKEFQPKLKEILGGQVNVIVSCNDKDPLVTI